MKGNQNTINLNDEGANRVYVDLIFNRVAGDSVKEYGSYEEQLEYYVQCVLPNYATMEAFIEYGQKYRGSSRYMFPGRPERIKNRSLLIKLFSGFVVFRELFYCDNYDMVKDSTKLINSIAGEFNLSDESEQTVFLKETTFLVKKYNSLSSSLQI